MNLDDLIATARDSYFTSGASIALPTRHYVPSNADMLRASSIGNCLLQLAYRKMGVEPDFSDSSPAHDWLLNHGSYVARMIQEPLMYHAMTHTDFAFEAEVPVSGDGIVGVMDGIITYKGMKYVLEIKNTEGMVKRSIGEPKLSYCYQLMAYMMLTGTTRGFIVTCAKWGWNTYPMEQVSDKEFVLMDKWGHKYLPPTWMPNFNTEEILNTDMIHQAVDTYRNYIADIQNQEPPIKDPLNDEGGFLCVWHKVKPTKTKKGIAVPNCQFAGRCHGLENKEYATEKEDGKYKFS